MKLPKRKWRKSQLHNFSLEIYQDRSIEITVTADIYYLNFCYSLIDSKHMLAS